MRFSSRKSGDQKKGNEATVMSSNIIVASSSLVKSSFPWKLSMEKKVPFEVPNYKVNRYKPKGRNLSSSALHLDHDHHLSNWK